MKAEPLHQALHSALLAQHPALAGRTLELMRDKGLAHDHVRLLGSGLLARLPKQSQLGLSASDNLAYQTACFERAAAGGHVPRLVGVIAPTPGLPRGGLLVEEIEGRPVRLPGDLAAIAETLASLHVLPLPPVDARAPLIDAADALAALQSEIRAQADYLAQARIESRSRGWIDEALQRLDKLVAEPARPAKCLISFDTHPGNYIVTGDGRAVLVDLEKARYSYAALDLAHATLVTSTTWDVDSGAELTAAQVLQLYECWIRAVGAQGDFERPWLVPLREAMWLWAVTWCSKWQVLEPRRAASGADGEDWSASRSDATLIAHIRNRVETYLSPRSIASVRAELAVLGQVLR
ncbi:MAG: aminoglycoside phosphotransferase family protein [Rhodoferax sp.]|nr:aminoglycoside phosphotransferase family protein [Rhodoferax sp.]